MRTIIVGCGRVGASLAGRLVREGDEVVVIDLKTEAFERLDDDFPGQAIRADGTDEDALRRAGADGVDRFFALTEGDNRNILAAQLAAETFKVPTVVAKINDPVRADAYAALGLATICRTAMMTESLASFLGLPAEKRALKVQAPTGSHHQDADDASASAAEG